MLNLKENEYLVYHYSASKFSEFDTKKADGFWFTDIEPANEEMIDEIGANGSNFVAKCIITINVEIDNFDNYDCFEKLTAEKCDGAVCMYDGFIDYCVLNKEQINVLEWMKL